MMKIATMLFTIVSLAGIVLWHYKRQPHAIRSLYLPALFLKIFSGIAVGLLYFEYYGAGDTVSYWQDSKIVGESILSDPSVGFSFLWDEKNVTIDGLVNDTSRSLFFVKISAILSIISFNNYWLMATMMSVVSFTGAWYIFKKISFAFSESKLSSAVSFLFFPSVVFWSSGLIKESIGLASIFFLAGIFLTIITHRKLKVWEYIVGVFCLWVGWNLKYYWIAVFMPVAVTSIIIAVMTGRFQQFKKFEIATWLLIFAVVLAIATSIHPNFYPSRFLGVIVQNNKDFVYLSKPENLIHYNNLTPTLSAVVINTPQALIGGFFRPFIWETTNLISFLASFENLLLVLFAVTKLPSAAKLFTSPNRMISIAVLMYCILLAVFLALSTPNFGTLSRYKIGFLPFFVFLLLYKNPIIAYLSKHDPLPNH